MSKFNKDDDHYDDLSKKEGPIVSNDKCSFEAEAHKEENDKGDDNEEEGEDYQYIIDSNTINQIIGVDTVQRNKSMKKVQMKSGIPKKPISGFIRFIEGDNN